ncbi:MAG: restriction endonuclease subunit S [Planctomycetaceae bacterium]|nr:restriction endonuclease subunit S [Planctomycetaceae bacterium]
MIDDLKPYAEYKESGVSWLGKVPVHWGMPPGFAAFREKCVKNIGMQEDTVLSLSYGRIVVKPKDKLHGLVPESFETYQIVTPGDIIVRSTDLQNDWNSMRVGLVRDRGIITSAYLCFQVISPLSPEYAHALLHTFDLMKVFYGLGSGLRQNLSFIDFKRMLILTPPPDEQAAIVKFLDYANGKIERAIRAKRKLIGLLNEQKQAIIHRAVTRGLDPNVTLKPSGIPWLGDVPEHWETARLGQWVQIERGKFTHRPRNDPRFYGGKYPFIQTGDISAAHKYIEQHSQTLNERGLLVSKIFKAGTLAMIITGAKTGHVAILNFDACFPDSAVALIPKGTKVRSNFLYYMSIQLKSELDRIAITSTQENLNLQRLRSQWTIWPPVEEQAFIESWLDDELSSINLIEAKVAREIILLREYRTTLTAEVVTGKLDVREAAKRLPDQADEPLPADDSLEDLDDEIVEEIEA